jgi:hypothetical protein
MSRKNYKIFLFFLKFIPENYFPENILTMQPNRPRLTDREWEQAARL